MKKMILFLALLSVIPIAFAQDQYSSRDIKPNMNLNTTDIYSLDFPIGSNLQQGDLDDFMKGFTRSELSLIPFNRGTQYSLSLWKRKIEIDGRSGLSIVKSPESPEVHTKTDSIGDNKAGSKDQDYKSSRIQRSSCSTAVVIARNSGGKHGEGRLPTAYSESLSDIRSISPAIGIDMNSGGKQGEGRLTTAYSKSLSKRSTSVAITDIARNSGGRNGEK